MNQRRRLPCSLARTCNAGKDQVLGGALLAHVAGQLLESVEGVEVDEVGGCHALKG